MFVISLIAVRKFDFHATDWTMDSRVSATAPFEYMQFATNLITFLFHVNFFVIVIDKFERDHVWYLE